MGKIANDRRDATKVLIRFEDGTVWFRIPRGAAFADLSEKFDIIGRWHKGPALSIDVRFGTSFDRPRQATSLIIPSLISKPAAAGCGQYRSASRICD